MEIQAEEEMAEELKEEEEEIKEEEEEAMVEIDLVQVAEGVQLGELGQDLEAELVHQEDRALIRELLAEVAHQLEALPLLAQVVVQEEVPVLPAQEVVQEEVRHHIKMLPVAPEDQHLAPEDHHLALEDQHLAPEAAPLLQKDLQQEKVAHHHLEVDPLAREAQYLEEEEVEVQVCQPDHKQVMVLLAVHRQDPKEAPLVMDLRE